MEMMKPSKSSLAVHLCFFLLLAAITMVSAQTNNTMQDMFAKWMKDYKVTYKTVEEKDNRFRIFTDNVNKINQMNNMGYPYVLAVNQFADRSRDEFTGNLKAADLLDGAPLPAPAPTPAVRAQPATSPAGPAPRPSPVASPTSAPRPPPLRSPTPSPSSNCSSTDRLDWRESGVINFIRDQGNCDSAYAFAAVAAIEGIWKIKKQRLVQLSEQQIVDCDRLSFGCRGGSVERAFTYTILNDGLNSRIRYPYTRRRRRCSGRRAAVRVAKIKSYTKVPAENETALKAAVARQPVSVNINADDIIFYSSGVFTGPCFTNLNHAMTAIGYGCDAETGLKFWLLRNSWGTQWGESGYMRLLRDYSDPRGLCGVAKRSTYPNV